MHAAALHLEISLFSNSEVMIKLPCTMHCTGSFNITSEFENREISKKKTDLLWFSTAKLSSLLAQHQFLPLYRNENE